HAAARRHRMSAVDLEQGRGAIDATIEQGRITRGEMQRSDGNAVAETDRHRLERAPARTGGQRPATLPELNRDGIEETHFLEEILLPLSANLIGDLRCADVGAVLHDLGDRALASVRFGVVDDVAVDVEFVWAIVDLAERLDDAAVHRHRDRERLEGRAELVDSES